MLTFVAAIDTTSRVVRYCQKGTMERYLPVVRKMLAAGKADFFEHWDVIVALNDELKI